MATTPFRLGPGFLRFLCFFVATVVASGARCAAGQSFPSDLESFASRVVERHLPNGLTLLIVERRVSPTVNCVIAFRTGGVDEPEGRSGVAHLYEHMAFMGTKSIGTSDWGRERKLLDRLDRLERAIREGVRAAGGRETDGLKIMREEFARTEALADELVKSEEIAQVYERNGAKGLNAFTSKDMTAYVIALPANRLELWAVMEAARIREPVLRRFWREKNVVMEERLRSRENDPYGRIFEAFQTLSFSAHPYAVPTIGWMSDLENVTREECSRFFREYYGPERMVISVVGDVDAGRVYELVRREFGKLERRGAAREVVTVEPQQNGERRQVVYFDSSPVLLIGYHVPTWGGPDKVAVDALASVLGEGRSSRLYKSLVKEKMLATQLGVFTGYPGERYPNLFTIVAIPRAPHGPEECETEILAQIGKIAAGGVGKDELMKVANQMEASMIQALSDNGSLADSLARGQVVTGDWRNVIGAIAMVRKLEPADIERVAGRFLSGERRNVAVLKREGH